MTNARNTANKSKVVAWLLAAAAAVMVCVLVVAVAGLLLVTYQDRIPFLQQEPERDPSIITIEINSPYNHAGWTTNAYIPLFVDAVSTYPLETLELYINDKLYQSYSVIDALDPTEISERWQWQPGAEGGFTLIVKGTDIFGANSFSQPLLLKAEGISNTNTLILAEEGDTLESIAAKANLTVEQLLAYNPHLNPSKPLETGQEIFIPNDPEPISNPNVIQGEEIPAGNEEAFLQPPPEEGAVEEFDATEKPALPIELQHIGIDWVSVNKALEHQGLFPPQNTEGDHEEPKEIPSEKEEPGISEEEKSKIPPFIFIQTPFKPIVFEPTFIEKAKELEEKLSKPTRKKVPSPYFEVQVEAVGCSVRFVMPDKVLEKYQDIYQSDGGYEDGFVIYRSRDGGDFETVFHFPEVVDLKDYPVREFIDKDQYGNLKYIVRVYNELGSWSTSMDLIKLDPEKCKPGQVPIEELTVRVDKDGNLLLPKGMDLAYFYVQMDLGDGKPGKARRMPAGNHFFLPNSGKPLNIYSYLDTLLKEVPEPDLDLFLDIWGWQGGELVHAGKYKYDIHRVILLICSVPGEDGCEKGHGAWSTSAYIPFWEDGKSREYKFMIIPSKLSAVGAFRLQMALDPYEDPYGGFGKRVFVDKKMNEQNPSAHKPFTFTVSLSDTVYSETENPWAPNDKYDKYTVYVRVDPVNAVSGLVKDQFTNVVTINGDTFFKQPTNLPPLQSELLSAFDIKVFRESYMPPNFVASFTWGCVIIEHDPSGRYQPGQKVCPQDLKKELQDKCEGFWKESKCILVEGFLKNLVEGYDWVAFAYDYAKKQVTLGVAYIIPGGCGDTCKGRIRKVVDYTVTYLTGLPPDLPQSEEVLSENLAILFINIMSELEKGMTGLDESLISELCKEDSKCREEIERVLREEIEQIHQIASQPACYDLEGLRRHGYEKPLCLPDNIKVMPARGATDSPGVIKLLITRKTTPETLEYDENQLYTWRRLKIGITTTGDYAGEKTMTFDPVDERFPKLEPGQSVELLIPLVPCSKSHRADCGKETPGEPFDFSSSYFGKDSIITIGEYCLAPEGSSEFYVPCTGASPESWEFQNPKSKKE